MSNQIKGGKKPLSAKPVAHTIDDIFGNLFTVDPELQKELADQGLEYRFIDIAKFKLNGGHQRGWVPYKRNQSPASATISKDFFLGSSPDGYIQRGTSVLATRSIEKGEAHRNFLKQRAEQYRNSNKQKAAELRQAMRDARLDSSVLEGYEENE